MQAIADYLGDLLGPSQAAATDADVTVAAGVLFTAETAAILNLGETVLVPDVNTRHSQYPERR